MGRTSRAHKTETTTTTKNQSEQNRCNEYKLDQEWIKTKASQSTLMFGIESEECIVRSRAPIIEINSILGDFRQTAFMAVDMHV